MDEILKGKEMKTRYIFILLLVTVVYAQNNGVISGKIIDAETKSFLPGANIIIIETEKGTASDNFGKFQLENLQPNTYRLKISFVGYETKFVTDVIVKNGRPAYLVIELFPKILETGNVMITSGYFTEQLKPRPSSVSLSKEEVRRFPGGFEDVVRTVATLPGVAVNNAGGRNDLIVRGGGPSENLYVVNNIEIPNINHFGTQGSSSGSLSFINLDFIDNVSFSTGGFGVKYGNKMSSVLELRLTSGRTDAFGVKTLISATQFGLNLEGPVSGNGNFLFSARKSYLDFIFKAAGQAFVPVYTDFNFLFNYDFSPTDKLFVIGLLALDKIDRNLDSRENRIKNERLMDNTQTQIIAGINYRKILKSGYFDATLNGNFYKFDFSQADALNVKYFESDAEENEYGLKFNFFNHLSNKVNITLGVSAKINSINNKTVFADSIYNSSGIKIPVSETGLPQKNIKDKTNYQYSFYAETEIKLSGKINMVTGIRSDIYDALDKSFYFSPRAGLKYSPDSKNSFKINYGIYYQALSPVWLVNEQNKYLKAPQNKMFIAGWEHLFDQDLFFKIEGYYKDYSNLPTGTLAGVNDHIVITNTGSQYGGRQDDFQSFGYFRLNSSATGKSYGGEIILQKKYSDTPYYGQISISVGKSELVAGNGKTYYNEFDQKFIFNFSAGYKLNEKWEISGKFRYFTGVPYTPVYKPGANPLKPEYIKNIPQEYLSDRLGAGHHLDLRIDRYFNYDSWTLILFIDIQNIYNYKIPIKPTYDFYDKEIKTSNSIGILPSIGISAEF